MAARIAGNRSGKYALRQNAEMNVTPFVDVMLVMLIIFMVSAPLATMAIKVDLPPPGKPLQLQARQPFISISRAGLSISGTPTSLDRLGADLNVRLGVARPTEENIMVRADRDVPYETFMAVVNQLKTDGYDKVALIGEDAV